jgi:Outer membrane efflux protein
MRKHFFLFFIVTLMTTPIAAQQKNLFYYINGATLNSPLLKDYNNQGRANMIDSSRIKASYKLQVTGNSINTYYPTINGWGYDNVITNGANVSELITVSQKLVSRQNLDNQYGAIRLLNEGLHTSGKISEQELKKTVTGEYITTFGIWQQFSFNNEMLGLLKKEEPVLKQLAQSGVYRETDYLTFLVTLKQQEIQVTQIRQQYQNEFATLNYVSGIVDTSFSELERPSLDSSMVPPLEQTVFYHQFEVDSLKLRNNDEQIDFAYKPKVSVYADGGYISSLMYQPYKNFGASFGVNIVVPIYDGHQKKMQHDKIAIAEQTRAQYRDFFKMQYHQQIAQLLQQLQTAQQLIEQSTSELKYAQGLIDANRRLLEKGDARIADYIIAIGNFITAKNVITQNTINKMQIFNQLSYWNKE